MEGTPVVAEVLTTKLKNPKILRDSGRSAAEKLYGPGMFDAEQSREGLASHQVPSFVVFQCRSGDYEGRSQVVVEVQAEEAQSPAMEMEGKSR
jgi:hypothetical protein